MPTGNGGITQGLALRLTNMEQGRREVTANALARDRMDAINEQRKAAAEYRKALADQKEAQRQQKQIDDLSKDIYQTDKGMHPIYLNETNKEAAAFLSRTIDNMKAMPNYTSTGAYRNEYNDLKAHQQMRLASSKNLFEGEKTVMQHADDYELQSDMYEAMKGLDYEKFVAANKGTDYVMPNGNIQPKFNEQKVREAMLKYATDGERAVEESQRVGGVEVITPVVYANPTKLTAMRDSYLSTMATANMPKATLEQYAQKLNTIYEEIKKEKVYGKDKVLNRTHKPTEPKAEKEDAPLKLTKTEGNTKTYSNGSVLLTDSEEVNGHIVTYKSVGEGIGNVYYGIPEKSTDGKGNEISGGYIANPNFHFLKNGKLVLVGELTDNDKKTTKSVAHVELPMNAQTGNTFAGAVRTQSKSTINIRYKNGRYTYDFNVGEGEKAANVKQVNNNQSNTPAPNTSGGEKNTNTDKSSGSTLTKEQKDAIKALGGTTRGK